MSHTYIYVSENQSHTVWPIPSSGAPHFVLHTMPVAHGAGKKHWNKLSQMISRAGEGPGLQIYPGSVPEVAPVSQRGGFGLCCTLHNLCQWLQGGLGAIGCMHIVTLPRYLSCCI